MANFCTRCGKKLDKDEKCTCEKIKATSNQLKQDNILDKIKDFISKPFDTLKNNNFQSNDYLLLLLTAISSCLIGSIFLRINILYLFVLAIVMLLLFTHILCYIINGNIMEVLSIVSLASIYIFIGNIVSMIFFNSSLLLMLLIMIISFILFINNVYQGLCFNNSLNKNKISYYIIISVIATIFILFFILKLI